jgi:hypothetical protein
MAPSGTTLLRHEDAKIYKWNLVRSILNPCIFDGNVYWNDTTLNDLAFRSLEIKTVALISQRSAFEIYGCE